MLYESHQFMPARLLIYSYRKFFFHVIKVQGVYTENNEYITQYETKSRLAYICIIFIPRKTCKIINFKW